MNDKYLTVTALTRYIKYKIESDNNLKKVYLKGEISNFKAHSTGHFYFSIKEIVLLEPLCLEIMLLN